MKTLLIAFTSLSTLAFGNPVATAIVEKTWERCMISAGEESSTVSCAVGYRGVESLNEPFYVSVPVIVPASLGADPAKVAALVKARVEIGGVVCKPSGITFRNDPLLPGGTVRAECTFNILRAKLRRSGAIRWAI